MELFFVDGDSDLQKSETLFGISYQVNLRFPKSAY